MRHDKYLEFDWFGIYRKLKVLNLFFFEFGSEMYQKKKYHLYINILEKRKGKKKHLVLETKK